MFDRCSDCPIQDGACWPRRSNNARMCRLPQYRDLVADTGAEGLPRGRPLPTVAGGPVEAPPCNPSAAGCPHFTQRWSCGGHDWIPCCALGRGQVPGIPEEDECRGCDRGEA